MIVLNSRLQYTSSYSCSLAYSSSNAYVTIGRIDEFAQIYNYHLQKRFKSDLWNTLSQLMVAFLLKQIKGRNFVSDLLTYIVRSKSSQIPNQCPNLLLKEKWKQEKYSVQRLLQEFQNQQSLHMVWNSQTKPWPSYKF